MFSRRVRAADFREPWLLLRAAEMAERFKVHRKLWEFAAIAEAFSEVAAEVRKPQAIGFGVGRDPLAAWIARAGGIVLATDHPSPTAAWTATGQHAASIADIRRAGILDEDVFRAGVFYGTVDMRDDPLLPATHEAEYDFLWSCGSLEHLGGLKAGADFVCRAMRYLRPGGLAAHTTEYNYASDTETLNGRDLALYRRRDLLALGDRLDGQGDHLRHLDLDPGTEEADCYVDEAPYQDEPHLALRVGGCLTTSVLLVVERGGEG